MIGGDKMDSEKVVEILIDIQSRLSRIEEKVSRQESVEAKADESLAIGKENRENYEGLELRIAKLEASRDWQSKTTIGSLITAAIAVLSWLLPHFW
ncbi:MULTISPECIES: hypothetical protein [Lactobacillaceae]|jgi:Protein of unknown function (DUF1267).|uniref:Holin n=1 Tax=Limosilactobacillus reuteri TaxID=1598 RepID=A0AAX2SRG7_LIMRT|nr:MULTISPECIES: hypothetical protein [Lactobacillaceae]MCH5379013.1 hemolysin XhlA family protein [Limosilactobacillus reuteri]OCW69849.1 hypothetical protein BBP14_02440 [Limosilactobacillus reuteri]OCW71659.1 hypothetical protein BBP13_10385 [Limosilactobacillus reuteri]TGB09685.1 holin [Limosilactobacillus reuteri]